MQDKEDLKQYRTGPMTLLELMAFFAVLGLLGAWVLHHFFSA